MEYDIYRVLVKPNVGAAGYQTQCTVEAGQCTTLTIISTPLHNYMLNFYYFYFN